MRAGLIAKKLGMSAYINALNEVIGVTFLKIDNCVVVNIKTVAQEGYNSVLLGSGLVASSKRAKVLDGFFKKNKVEYRKKLKEFRLSDDSSKFHLKVGEELNCDYFQKGQLVDVRSKNIGKGFAGGMKRHNFRGLEATHGVSVSHRSHGSTGGHQDPGRVFKNKKMAGHMGNSFVTMRNLEIVDLDLANNIIILKGSVPGSKGGYVYLRDAKKHLYRNYSN